MWFRYPDGISSVNVEQQEFAVEHKDRDGHQYFRAPESLAKALLTVPGFAVVSRPADAPADLKDDTPASTADPLAQLSSQVETMRTENEALKKGQAEVTAENTALKNEVAALGRQLAQAGQQAATAGTATTGGTVGTSGTQAPAGAAPAAAPSPAHAQGHEAHREASHSGTRK